eukprot:COSAG05_NODE_15384_length_371_cov_0.683824_2_plen_74_part_01
MRAPDAVCVRPWLFTCSVPKPAANNDSAFDEGAHIARRGCQRHVIAGRESLTNTCALRRLSPAALGLLRFVPPF